MVFNPDLDHYISIITDEMPVAMANLTGSEEYPDIQGVTYFYNSNDGILVVTNVRGLPTSNNICKWGVYAYHIHGGRTCSGTMGDPFSEVLGHFNPYDCTHPNHVGDMPPLFENNGHAFMIFLTARFTIDMVMGRAAIIHSLPDDFTSQPSGNSGYKMACGIIVPYTAENQ